MRAVSGPLFAACGTPQALQDRGHRCSNCACHFPPCHKIRDLRKSCGRSYRGEGEDFHPTDLASKYFQIAPFVHPVRQIQDYESRYTPEILRQTAATLLLAIRGAVDRVRTEVLVDVRSASVQVDQQVNPERCSIVVARRFSLECWVHRSWRAAACRRHVTSDQVPFGRAAFHW